MIALTFLLTFTVMDIHAPNVHKPTFVVVKIDRITKSKSCSYCNDDRVVILKHLAGEPLNIKNMKIHVTVSRNGSSKSCILQNFPWRYGIGIILTSNELVGDDIIDRNPNDYAKYLGEISYKSDGFWSSGESIGFRIKREYLSSGDDVHVLIEYGGELISEDSKIFDGK
ncbi:hypothetical protein [Archaeoglobus sp.]